jgi:hypothetical protein
MSATVIIHVLSGEELKYYVKAFVHYESLTDEQVYQTILEDKEPSISSLDRAEEIARSNEKYSRTKHGIQEYHLVNPAITFGHKHFADFGAGSGAGFGASGVTSTTAVDTSAQYLKQIVNLEREISKLKLSLMEVSVESQKKLVDLESREYTLEKRKSALESRECDLESREYALKLRERELCKQEGFLSLGMLLSTSDLTPEELVQMIQMTRTTRMTQTTRTT